MGQTKHMNQPMSITDQLIPPSARLDESQSDVSES